jgi:hypothetical protein
MNPNIMPGIISTYPANGSVGPFDNIYPNGAHFYVHFNKLMDKSSFTSKTITCEGFDVPVVVQPSYYDNYSSSQYGDIIGFNINRKTGNYSIAYHLNTVYTILIDSTVKDFNGNQLGHQFKFSFVPDPYFRVTYFSFNDGDTIQPSNGLSFSFNSKITPQTLSAMHLTPNPLGSSVFKLGYDSTYVYLSSVSSLIPSTKYTISIDQNCSDISGNQLKKGESRSFFTQQFGLSYVDPSYRLYLDLYTPIYLSFTHPIDTTTVRSAFHISPDVGYILRCNYSSITFMPSSDFKPSTNYVITLSTQLKSSAGIPLSSPVSVSFTTGAFREYHEPSAGYYYPVSRLVNIRFEFNGRIDTSSFRSAFSVSPAINGVINFEGGYEGYNYTVVRFAPIDLLPPFTVYYVKLDSTLRSIGGYQLAYPDTFSFVTGGSIQKK